MRGLSLAKHKRIREIVAYEQVASCSTSPALMFAASDKLAGAENGKTTLPVEPVLKEELGFAEKLYAENPQIAPEEFARKVVQHYKLNPSATPERYVDENGAILWKGKPVFPITFYHVGQNDPRVKQLQLNSFMGSCEREAGDKRIYSNIDCYSPRPTQSLKSKFLSVEVFSKVDF